MQNSRDAKQQILIYPDIKWCSGTFSFVEAECAGAIVRIAEKAASPVCLCVNADLVEPAQVRALGLAASKIAESSTVPVEVAISHLRRLDFVERALDQGFSTIICDGSFLPFARNIEFTAAAAGMAHGAGVAIEGEIGAFGDFGKDPSGQCMIGGLAEEFVRETGIDSLLISIPADDNQACPLDIENLHRVRNRIGCGLSLEEARGLSPKDILLAVSAGVTRLVFPVCLRNAAPGVYDPFRKHLGLEEAIRLRLLLVGSVGIATSTELPGADLADGF